MKLRGSSENLGQNAQKNHFALANFADTDKMLLCAAFNLGLRFVIGPVKGFPIPNGFKYLLLRSKTQMLS